MTMKRPWAMLFAGSLLLASPALAAKISPADDTAVRAEVKAMYASYSAPIPEDGSDVPGSDLPDYSAKTEAMITQWKNGLDHDELTPLQDFDWLCQCQDFDNATAKLTAVSLKPAAKGRIDAKAVFASSPGYKGTLRIRMVKEGSRWLVDDLFFEGGGQLTKMLAREIIENKAIKAKAAAVAASY